MDVGGAAPVRARMGGAAGALARHRTVFTGWN